MKRCLILLTSAIFLTACGPSRFVVPALRVEPTPTAGPAVAELVLSTRNPGSLIVDSQALYWSSCDAWESTHGTIMRLSKPQGTVETLTSDQACPFSLQADDHALYWIDHEDIAGGVHHIFRLPKSGGPPQVVTSDRSVFRTLRVDDSYLYWWTEDGTAMRLSKNGRGQPEALPFPARYIMAFDGADVYWVNANGDLIRSRNDGSRAVTLVPGSDFAPATAEGHQISRSIAGVYPGPSGVYLKVYTDGNPGMVSCTDQSTTLMKMGKDGGQPVRVAHEMGYADTLFVGPSVYLGDNCTEGIIKLNLESQARELFVRDPVPVWFIETDGEYIYWITREGDGAIKRARR